MEIIINQIIGYVILIVVFFTYLPQYVKIIKNKSSSGISEFFLTIGYIGSICSWNNAFVFYYKEWEQCQGFFNCGNSILGFNQVFIQWLCFLIFFTLYLIYKDKPRGAKIIAIYITSNILVIPIFITTYLFAKGIVNIRAAEIAQDYADVLSILSIIACCLQYIPQIWKTFKQKSPGNFSLIMLLLQSPGTYIWATYLALQKGSNITTWLPLIITATWQLILLIMGFYYTKMQKKYMPLDDEENLIKERLINT